MPWPLTDRNSPSTFKGRLLFPATLVSFALAGAFILFLVKGFDIDLGAIGDSFKESNPFLFALALLVHYTTFLFRGARWRILLKNAQNDPLMSEPKTLHCSALILLGWFTNSVTWFRLGDAYRAHAYADDTGGSFPLTIGTVLAERLLDMALVFLLLTLATLFLAASGVGISWVFLGLAAIMSVGLAGIILIMGVFRSRLARFLPGPLKGAYQRFY